MLLIETYVAESKIPGAGRGVFCAKSVPAGTVIWEFTDGLDYIVTKLPENPLHRKFVCTYGYVPLGGSDHWVMCVDDARFMNHSKDPTCLDDGRRTTARFDLPAGTELTSNYWAFSNGPFSGFEPSRD